MGTSWIELEMLQRMDFATALRTARIMAGLEQDELAASTGVPVQIIIRWESSHDNHWPSAIMRPRLCEALGPAAEYLDQWDMAQRMVFRQLVNPRPAMTATDMLQCVIQLGAEFGDVARVAGQRLADGDCAPEDAKALTKELRDVLGKAHQLMSALPGVAA